MCRQSHSSSRETLPLSCLPCPFSPQFRASIQNGPKHELPTAVQNAKAAGKNEVELRKAGREGYNLVSMSAESEVVSKAHFDYIAARTAHDDAFLADLKREARTAGIPAIQIAPEQASLMQILLRLCGAREVVEVGTLAGYSAIWMARALPQGGRVRTIDPFR